jgi:hypothetical protein
MVQTPPECSKIKENLDFFSELTQRTLSAFHTQGPSIENDEDLENTKLGETSLDEEIATLKRFITNSNVKKIRKIDRVGQDYIILFTDGSKHTCKYTSELYSNFEYDKTDKFDVVEKAFSSKISSVTSIRLGNDIKVAKDQSISRPSERIFFSIF